MAKEKRSLFNIIFGNKKQKNISFPNILKLLSGYIATYSNVSENIDENIIARECIDTIATHCAKMLPQHYQEKKRNKKSHIWRHKLYIKCKT